MRMIDADELTRRMTLDEQILFMEELLSDDDHWSCENAKSEYRQVQEWLKELKAWREWQTVYADSSIIVMRKGGAEE